MFYHHSGIYAFLRCDSGLSWYDNMGRVDMEKLRALLPNGTHKVSSLHEECIMKMKVAWHTSISLVPLLRQHISGARLVLSIYMHCIYYCVTSSHICTFVCDTYCRYVCATICVKLLYTDLNVFHLRTNHLILNLYRFSFKKKNIELHLDISYSKYSCAPDLE